ncbi:MULTISPECIES: nitrate reductase subunit alpha [Streptomyces]|uniref:Nitrate reductase alpha subunit n=3 Tax=Streptomyces rimosus TaxID=1927 RepID=L8ELA5_STRR1|nr:MULTISPECIES: nitrate reductase subunit alpha [Streptomyces]KOG80139.1 nitrate reductase [Kitasatospora aureofaciens]MYT41208.1 nitrate reductase subunit alpha [Streptomyces sp. SID5471]KUJ25831.1 nitrate reductase [Streptomyces rimosus subsp. rimosus]QDA08498.1 nitrate reductase subunit alpha [Streptomyces rimosus]QEV79776.1 nitrate reductase subunit alpha [Streptomyces rimosus]
MSTGTHPERSTGLDGPLAEALVNSRRFFTRARVSDDGRTLYRTGGRAADAFYRDRWSHDKVVRSTHGVNCTGSCSWKVFVKDGIITWEAQQTDYPSVGPDRPEYEPRGCPRGAAFSWYTYSPTRVRYPYVRGVLLQMYREARQRLGDPVLAWADIVGDPERARRYKAARGRGGLLRATWEEAAELVAAAHVHTIKEYGPDRLAGFSPIPAMSMVSHAAGARFYSLLGGVMLSFYDWYADLPVASPQVFGDQTDVPESGDWWDAGYLIMWGANLPVTRTPDAHWMAEARYRGQKVVAVAPDYADNVKFADEWLHARPGTDGALAMAMGHVVLREFFVERETAPFISYVKRFTDLPFLVVLDESAPGRYTPGKFLTAADLGGEEGAAAENAEFRTVLLDAVTGRPVVPGGTLGHRYGESGAGRWNLDLGDIDPLLTAAGGGQAPVPVELSRFDAPDGKAGRLLRGVPVRQVGGRTVTTVYDLLLAQYGVAREGLPGRWPTGYDDAAEPYTPAWQEPVTGVAAEKAARIAREFAANAEESGGRSMIIMGAGTNHWFHSDTIYRAFLTLTTLTGCQGVNGGGWAHYVGQEKVRPITGYSVLATAADWNRPARQMIQTAYWYLHTDQFRYDPFGADTLTAASADGTFAGRSTADVIAQSARLGWMPSYPTFDRNPLTLAADAEAAGQEVGPYVVDELKAGRLRFAAEDPDAPENFPRVLTVWRANLLGSSAKGNEYFLKHLLGTDSAVRATEAPEGVRPRDVTWREQAPTGKLDLLLSLDFRMTSTTLYSDVVLPAATWYEKHDLNSTDMHPFVHAFNPAISPPWQTRTDFDAFHTLARAFSRLAAGHLGTATDVVAAPLLHDTPDAMATPHGRVRDWKAGECEPVPGRTMPKLIPVERDYTAVADKMAALGPLLDTLGATTKGVTFDIGRELEYLRHQNGTVRGGAGDGRPSLARDVHACEAILALSGTTNGHLATQGFRTLEARTGTRLADLAAEHEGKRITFADTQARPVPVITSPEWSGSESGGRRYAPFTINTERLKPWHTLTGRQHFFLDHDWIAELGEQLPVYRPPLDMAALFGEPTVGSTGELGVTVRYLTPHNKWSIHSEYQDNLFMLSLSRGGPTVWMSQEDAAKIGVADNDWIEAVNRNGVVAARAVVTHRMPEGTVYMHHAQDRLIDVPRTETTGRRGGIHNSLTRLLIKPSHLIGGYAQLSFAFNYLGPTGNQRDEVTVIRRRSQEVTY